MVTAEGREPYLTEEGGTKGPAEFGDKTLSGSLFPRQPPPPESALPPRPAIMGSCRGAGLTQGTAKRLSS